MPKVSIIIPVYNVEKYLKKCLNCIVNQTLTDFEVICINDGSTDNSLEILNEYAKNDKRFIVISQENQGQGVARNRCLELVKGEYIQFIDPDDWVETNMLETLYDFAKKHDSQIVKFDYFEFFEYSNKLKKIDFVNRIKKDFKYDLISKPYYSWRQLKKGCLTKLELCVWTYFYSAEFIKSNNIRFNSTKLGEDHLFANGALILADRVDYLNEYLYYYRIRSGSAVNIKSDQNFCVFDNVEQFKKFLIQHSLYEELKDEFKDYAQQAVCWPYDMIPQESKKRYEELCCRYFESEKDFKKLIKAREKGRSFIENIFSIKNKRDGAKKYKVITVLGCPFVIKPKSKEVINVEI